MNSFKVGTYRWLLVTVIVLCNYMGYAQGGTWVWMTGDTSGSGAAVFGTKGVPAPGNTPPGLYEAPNWIDLDGNLWVFGGPGGNNGNDMWKFNPASNMWTWVNGPGQPVDDAGSYGTMGVPAPTNLPPARSLASVSWTDNNGDLWLFAGLGSGLANGNLNDLWRFNIASNEWTWMSGSNIPGETGSYGTQQVPSSTNVPPGKRETNAGWVDNNNRLWFFGGVTVSFCNDMWMYDISTNIWTWMKGDSTGLTSSYGIKGVEAAGNLPTARMCYTRWKDITGNFYIWGGDAAGNRDDVWKFNPLTNNWTWIAGDSLREDSGSYTAYCVDGGEPMGRFENRTAQVLGCTNIFVAYGGSNSGYQWSQTLDDLWTFNSQTLEWKWLNGTNGPDTPLHSFGVKGVPAATNLPYGRMGQCMWIDNEGLIWVFSGVCGAQSGGGNDLWKFIPDGTCFRADSTNSNPNYTLSQTTLCRGDSARITFYGDSNMLITPGNSVTWLNNSNAILKPDSTTTYRVSDVTPCGNAVVQDITIHVISSTINIVANKTNICPGDTAQVCAAAVYTNYLWNNGETTSCINALAPGNYYVTVTQNGNCTATSNQINISTYPIPQAHIIIHNDTLIASGDLTYQWLLNGAAIPGAIFNMYVAGATGTYSLQFTDSNGCAATDSKQMEITRIAEELTDNSISIFPNPTRTGWQLIVDANLMGGVAEIFDGTGRLVYKSIITNQQSSIFIPAEATGIYELRITSNQFSVVRKLAKL